MGDKDDWKAETYGTKLRTFVPVVVRGEEGEGVRFWGFGKTVYQEILGYIGDPDYGDITDPTSGRDLTIEYKSEEMVLLIQLLLLELNQKNQHLSEDSDKATNFIENQTEITDLYSELSYDELKSVLEGWLNPTNESGDESVSQETLSTSTQPATETKSAPEPTKSDSKKTDDVSETFDDLFNN